MAQHDKIKKLERWGESKFKKKIPNVFVSTPHLPPFKSANQTKHNQLLANISSQYTYTSNQQLNFIFVAKDLVNVHGNRVTLIYSFAKKDYDLSGPI